MDTKSRGGVTSHRGGYGRPDSSHSASVRYGRASCCTGHKPDSPALPAVLTAAFFGLAGEVGN